MLDETRKVLINQSWPCVWKQKSEKKEMNENDGTV